MFRWSFFVCVFFILYKYMWFLFFFVRYRYTAIQYFNAIIRWHLLLFKSFLLNKTITSEIKICFVLFSFDGTLISASGLLVLQWSVLLHHCCLFVWNCIYYGCRVIVDFNKIPLWSRTIELWWLIQWFSLYCI